MSLSPVSLTSHFVASYAESQLGADPFGVNRIYNCVPASAALVLQALGYSYIHPQALEDLVYGVGHVGGSDFGTFIRRLAELGRWPGLPRMILTDTSATDTVAFIHAALAQGYAVICDFKDDANAQLVPQWHTDFHGTHASVAVAVDATTISIINVWTGVLQSFSHAVFGQATTSPAGNVWVWQRDIRAADNHAAGGIQGMALSPGARGALAHVVLRLYYGHEPAEKQWSDFVNTINADESNLSDLVQAEANRAATNSELMPLQPMALRQAVDELRAKVDALDGAAASVEVIASLRKLVGAAEALAASLKQ